MIVLDAAAVERATPWEQLIPALAWRFRQGCEAPPRHHHSFAIAGETAGTLLLMPAWTPDEYLGVKLVSVVPGNGARGLPAVAGTYILSSAKTGQVLAAIDGATLTARRTAAASALASSFLSWPESAKMLLVGTGALSAGLAAAHASVRPFRRIAVWGRDRAKAEDAVARIRALGLPAESSTGLEADARGADVISCATLSTAPLIRGAWLKPGAHLDLVGAFRPDMRESDDEAVRRASLFVDTRAGALAEGGDLVQPVAAGIIAAGDIRADLAELCRGAHPGRGGSDEITLFKSVGAALEDLTAAILVYEQHAP